MTIGSGVLNRGVKTHCTLRARGGSERRVTGGVENFCEGNAFAARRRNAEEFGQSRGFVGGKKFELPVGNESARAQQRGIQLGEFAVDRAHDVETESITEHSISQI